MNAVKDSKGAPKIKCAQHYILRKVFHVLHNLCTAVGDRPEFICSDRLRIEPIEKWGDGRKVRLLLLVVSFSVICVRQIMGQR